VGTTGYPAQNAAIFVKGLRRFAFTRRCVY
jgi:hypothetical protein